LEDKTLKRIYDAEFATTTGSQHEHLGTFWWTDGSQTGKWTRLEAYNYVSAYPNTVYVSEGTSTVLVKAYYNALGTKWIQTVADGVLKDNLTTLAIRHRQGLINN